MSSSLSTRLAEEQHTMGLMMKLFCRAKHGTKEQLCEECAALYAYAEERVKQCPFGEKKPVCSQCQVHCYKPEMRERIRAVMRYAGPRMIFYHPRLAIRHLMRSIVSRRDK